MKKKDVMLRTIKIVAAAAAVFAFLVLPVSAGGRIKTDIKVIHASTGEQHVDPGLESIISELKSVFKYTSYRLMKTDSLEQGLGTSGDVPLPGGRTLVILPQSMEGNRINYQIQIRKNSKIIFKTRVLLKNNSSITIGGPRFKNGTLLFDIAGNAG